MSEMNEWRSTAMLWRDIGCMFGLLFGPWALIALLAAVL